MSTAGEKGGGVRWSPIIDSVMGGNRPANAMGGAGAEGAPPPPLLRSALRSDKGKAVADESLLRFGVQNEKGKAVADENSPSFGLQNRNWKAASDVPSLGSTLPSSTLQIGKGASNVLLPSGRVFGSVVGKEASSARWPTVVQWSSKRKAVIDRVFPDHVAQSAQNIWKKAKNDTSEPPPLPPPQLSLDDKNIDVAGDGGDAAEVWRRFRSAGLLDQDSLRNKEREALTGRIAEVEGELCEYQHNMGLILIEKEELTTKCEEMKQELDELREIMNREQTTHLMTISEFERHEENLHKALDVEKQCVADLEMALREIQLEISETKAVSDKKLHEAEVLEGNLDERKLEIQKLLHSADAKMAEANRKQSLVDRTLEDLESRERILKSEKSSYETEYNIWKKACTEREQDLNDWELQLKERETRIIEERRTLHDREKQTNEREVLVKKKEEEHEKKVIKFDASVRSLKTKEDDVASREVALSYSEKDVDIKKINLERLEKELRDREQKLKGRETVGLQKLFEEHEADLESKSKAFELEMQQKRVAFDEEWKRKTDDLERSENNFNFQVRELSTRERALETGWEKLREKENELQTKLVDLRKMEETIRSSEKKVLEERTHVEDEKQYIGKCKWEMQNLKLSIEAEKNQLVVERENLKVTETDRAEHNMLVSQLKQEIDNYRKQTDLVLKEKEDLKQRTLELEGEWEVLDAKCVGLQEEFKTLNDERETFKKWAAVEESRLKCMELEICSQVKKEREELELERRAFADEKRHERSEIEELLKKERDDNNRSLELHRHKLEMELEKRLSLKESELQRRENELKQKMDFVDDKIKHAIDANESKIQKIIFEKEQLRGDREALFDDRKRIELERAEIKKDVDQLTILSRNLKDRREEYIREKSTLISLVENWKVCKNCGVRVINDLDLLRLQNTENTTTVDVHHRVQSNEAAPPGTSFQSSPVNPISWLTKYSRLFKVSPGKRLEEPSQRLVEQHLRFSARLDRTASGGDADFESTPALEMTDNQTHDLGAREDEQKKDVEVHDMQLPSAAAENSASFLQSLSDRGSPVLAGSDMPHVDQNLPAESSYPDVPPGFPALPGSQVKQQQQHMDRRGRSTALRKTRSVKAVVDEAKTFLGESLEGVAEDSHDDSIVNSVRQKRRHDDDSGVAAIDEDADSEARSDGIFLVAQRSKRRQISGQATPDVGQSRYNFRRRTSTMAATPAPSGKTGTPKPRSQKVLSAGIHEGTSNAEKTLNPHQQPAVTELAIERRDVLEFVAQVETRDTLLPTQTDEGGLDAAGGPTVELEAESPNPASSEFPSEQDEDEEDEDGASDEDQDDKASLGKKIWKFLTS